MYITRGCRLEFLNKDEFQCLEIGFILENSVHCLPKYSFTGFKYIYKGGFQDQLSFNAGQKYCKMLQGEHFAILLTFIKLPFVIKIFVLSICEWPFKTGLLYMGEVPKSHELG